MIRAILTDIEGTTSSISFVKEVLFPYARNHLAEFIESHSVDPKLRTLLDDVCTEAGQTLDGEQIIQQLIHWIDEDKKVTPLKSIQGMIWEHGYDAGEFTGHVYEDVVDKLQNWCKQGIKLFVFSSGSVKAQKLLFEHSTFGDLASLFTGHFDTSIGSKQDVSSYHKISQEIKIPENEILFLSDSVEELDAAASAGMKTLQLVRKGDGTIPASNHNQVGDFSEINLDI